MPISVWYFGVNQTRRCSLVFEGTVLIALGAALSLQSLSGLKQLECLHFHPVGAVHPRAPFPDGLLGGQSPGLSIRTACLLFLFISETRGRYSCESTRPSCPYFSIHPYTGAAGAVWSRSDQDEF